MSQLREFVELNVRWFNGPGKETEERLQAAESQLGVKLPEDVRWVLKQYGYWHATGICSLEDLIEDTNQAREHLNLPQRYVVLYNHHDGGGILLDTQRSGESNSYLVHNVDWYSVPDSITEEITHPSYLAYTQEQLALKRDFLEPEDVDYDPTLYRF